ncbi:MAG: iron ABC transporter permease [Alphaproteobacteria bacterium]|nr:iron ABC transporter permease [Alphaproteobacteria bacterium]
MTAASQGAAAGMLPRGLAARVGPLSAERLLVAVLVALLTVMVIVPLVAVAMTGFNEADGLTLRHFADVFARPRTILNTLAVGVGATAIAITIGGALALILARTNAPGRRLLERLVIIPLYITPLLTAIAWSWLGSPRGGLVNMAAKNAFGIDQLINLQSPTGVVLVTALSYVPLPFLLIGGALRGMDPSLEESARVHGASAARTLRVVTLPLILPASLGSALLVFVQAIGLFSVPAVLGMPSDFFVATTEIYRLLDNYPPRVGQAAAWGLVLLVLTASLIALQARILGRRSFVTITGKAFRPRTIELGGVRYLLAALVWLYVALAIVLPVLVLVWAASISFLTIDVHMMEWSLKHFRYILFQYPKTYLALQNSTLLGFGTATLVVALGLVVSWVVVRTKRPARHYLDQVSMFPLSTPAMVFALGLLWVYVGIKFLPIYGTIWILLLSYVTHYLPFGVRSASGALRQLHPELEDAARVTGASWSKTMRWVTFPLTRPTLAAAWTLLFIMSMQEVSSSILLYTSRTVVLSVTVFDLWETGNPNALAALAVIQLALTFIVVAVVIRARHREVLS